MSNSSSKKRLHFRGVILRAEVKSSAECWSFIEAFEEAAEAAAWSGVTVEFELDDIIAACRPGESASAAFERFTLLRDRARQKADNAEKAKQDNKQRTGLFAGLFRR